jgi:predicted permease
VIDSINALIPVFLVIAIGMAIRKINYLPGSIWPALDQLCWFLLFPLLIIKTLSQADLSSVPIEGLAGVLLFAAGSMVALLFLLKPVLARFTGLDGPGYTSFFQGTSRWNGFAALAIIKALYGDEGLVLGALSFAVLVPVLQTTNILVLTLWGEPEDHPGEPFSVQKLFRQLSKNPMLVSIAIGLSLNFISVQLSGVVETTLNLIAASALGLSLLAVGAGLKFDTLGRMKINVILSAALKLIAMPLLIVVACNYLDVDGLSREVAVVCGAAPTAGTAYIMARQMGGDADMAAAIITVQTLAAVVTLPLMLFWLG